MHIHYAPLPTPLRNFLINGPGFPNVRRHLASNHRRENHLFEGHIGLYQSRQRIARDVVSLPSLPRLQTFL